MSPLRASVFFLAFAANLSAVQAAPLVRSLGDNLVYCRVHELPADLPTSATVARKTCILDVRYVSGGKAAAAELRTWLLAHAAPKAPVLLLANAETSPDLLAPLASADSVDGLVILGSASPGFGPDIALAVSPEDERRAYDALERGAGIESLINQKVDKVRDDEARLDKEHLSDNDPDADAPPDQPDADKEPAQILDPVLRRAVQLHSALVALRRLK